MKIKTKAYSPLCNNTGDIGNGSSIDIEISSYGWIGKNSNRPNSISIKRPGQPFIKNNDLDINSKDVFIIEDFMGHVYHIKKKKDSILDSLIAAIIRSETSFEDVILCINDVNDDKVIDLDFFKIGGNIDNYINPKWLKFSKSLWRQRSVGLGTPNAASGEGELMFIFLSPKIKKPTRGDLSINDENVEVKGEETRVNGKVSGRNFRDKTILICNKYGLTPNIASRTNLLAVEIEKHQHEIHWVNELNKLSIDNRIHFISDYFKCIDGEDFNASFLFNDGMLDFKELKRTIVKVLYKSMVSDRMFDKFIILGDGSNAKILGRDLDKFNKDIDNGVIEVKSDYFRINQDAVIGWYIF